MKCIYPADILLPNDDADKEKYACVACDQFTSDPNYWKEVEKTVGDAPSTFKMTFPEIYLSSDNSERTEKICNEMRSCLENGFFREIKNNVIYLKRTLFSGKVRKGLVACVDLDSYDFSPDSCSPVRATEGTIEDRLPPRVKIRENAPLEFPHIMILINDKCDEVFSLAEKEEKKKEYSVNLMCSGGKIEGYSFANPEKIIEKAEEIASHGKIKYAVGDGNHSLATAKKCWENLKKSLSEEEKKTHPARFALCEIVNLYDSALTFEPIHRVLFNVDEDELLAFLSPEKDGHAFEFVSDGKTKKVFISPTHELAVGSLQQKLDKFLLLHPEARIDYVHEKEQVCELAKQHGVCGMLLDAMDKNSLFSAVEKFGSLPRKTFSMGEGRDKRYYFEARKIR